MRHRGTFSYVDGVLPDGTTLKLCRLRYGGSAHQWGFAIYRASHDDYDESVFPTGSPVGTCEDALDTACGLYLGDPTAWTARRRPPRDHRDNGVTGRPEPFSARNGRPDRGPWLDGEPLSAHPRQRHRWTDHRLVTDALFHGTRCARRGATCPRGSGLGGRPHPASALVSGRDVGTDG